ncbi:MAG: beta-hexosaminidase [Lachnospiraceae bacterium]|nr:beta-hexosaminidase [Lachnospiraceae bacterium]
MKGRYWIGILCLIILIGFLFLGDKLFGKQAYIAVEVNRTEMVHLAAADQGIAAAVCVLKENERQERKRQEYIAELIKNMSLEEKLAQMMILTNEKDIISDILNRYQPGGILLFAKDFTGNTTKQVQSRVDTLQSYMTYPLFVTVDEEGGQVSRISGMAVDRGERNETAQGQTLRQSSDEAHDKLPEFQSARVLYGSGDLEAVQADTIVKSDFLMSMGINLNFGPVADVVKSRTAYMYDRSASGVAQETAEYVSVVVKSMGDSGIGSCLKHFPGYGNNVNTHTTYAKDSKSLETYQSEDFLPFETGIASGADMVMVSHIVMEAVDGENPASLSPAVHELLRNELGFTGVVIADDLNMRAVLNSMTLEKATEAALTAGNDMVFSADLMKSMKGAKQALTAGEITEQQVDKAVARILRLKMKLGLIDY